MLNEEQSAILAESLQMIREALDKIQVLVVDQASANADEESDELVELQNLVDNNWDIVIDFEAFV